MPNPNRHYVHIAQTLNGNDEATVIVGPDRYTGLRTEEG